MRLGARDWGLRAEDWEARLQGWGAFEDEGVSARTNGN